MVFTIGLDVCLSAASRLVVGVPPHPEFLLQFSFVFVFPSSVTRLPPSSSAWRESTHLVQLKSASDRDGRPIREVGGSQSFNRQPTFHQIPQSPPLFMSRFRVWRDCASTTMWGSPRTMDVYTMTLRIATDSVREQEDLKKR